MTRSLILFLAIVLMSSCKTTTYFVVRHAEKSENTMTSDVPLSETGRQRAEALKEKLKGEKIGTIYSTNYERTRSTVKPLADAMGITIQLYDPRDTSFISRLKMMGNKDQEGNRLIVGHSNTVDDIVNQIIGERVIPGDLPETQYGDLFIIRQKGKRFSFKQQKFGN